MNDPLPAENWSLERLGHFCSRTHKKMAVDAWRLGHALNLARAKQSHGDWQKWKKQYVPHLTHSSEHRYRTLAKRLTEQELEGVGLTEAYRLLDLTYTKGRGRGVDDPSPGAPDMAPAEDARTEDDAPDDTDDLAALPPPAPFHAPLPATGVMVLEAHEQPPQMPTGILDGGVGQRSNEGGSSDSSYRLRLLQARRHMEGLRAWAEWLMLHDEGSLVEMWHQHRLVGITEEIELTVERLRWASENLAW